MQEREQERASHKNTYAPPRAVYAIQPDTSSSKKKYAVTEEEPMSYSRGTTQAKEEEDKQDREGVAKHN